MIFAPDPDYRVPVESMRLVADEVELFGGKSVWTRLEAALPDGSTLIFTPLDLEKPGGEGQQAAAWARGYFTAVTPDGPGAAAARETLLQRLARARWVVRLDAEPALSEVAHPAIGAILQAVDGMLFDGSGMVDRDGTLLLDADGTTEVEGGAD